MPPKIADQCCSRKLASCVQLRAIQNGAPHQYNLSVKGGSVLHWEDDPGWRYPVEGEPKTLTKSGRTVLDRRCESAVFTNPASASAFPNAFPFATRKTPFDVPVQGAHDADARKHRRPVALRNEDKRLHGGLPFRRVMFGFRQFGDIGAGILECDELSAVRQRYRIFEGCGPGQSLPDLP